MTTIGYLVLHSRRKLDTFGKMILQQSFQQESFELDSSNSFDVSDELSGDVLELMAQLQQILPKKTDSKLDIIECAIEYISELNAMLLEKKAA